MYQNFQDSFTAILANLIEERGVSQKWVADQSGLSEAAISRYVKGVQKPQCIDILYTLSKVFNVPVDYLIGATPTYEKQELTDEEKILINCFRRASKDDKDIIRISLRKYMTTSEKLYSQAALQPMKQTKTG